MPLDNNVTFLENVQGGAAVARLLEEIGEVYKTACHCGCGVDGVLTQVELIDALISRGAVPESRRVVVPEREEPRIWMIRELDGPNRSRCVHAIRHEGVEYLSELRDWTFFRLRRIPTIGLISARAIELAMARRVDCICAMPIEPRSTPRSRPRTRKSIRSRRRLRSIPRRPRRCAGASPTSWNA